MERPEINRRWMARQPVEGIAFFPNESVQVTSGPHTGSRGAVISLIDVEPTPLYAVELGDGTEVRLHQADLIGATAQDPGAALSRVQRWYASQCDGDWEHQLGVEIRTLDNPGWTVKIDLKDTELESAAFAPVRDLEDEREWVDCKVVDAKFRGFGGPHMLGAILEIFVCWAENESRRTE